jgi:hypothetical protein
MKSKLAVIITGAGLLVAAAPLLAHHSFAGTYLEDAPPVKIEGKLVQFLLRNPHSFVHVEAKDDKTGEMIRWSIEWGAAGQLAQQGVGREALKVGDTVVVVGSPGRNPADHRLRMRTITRPSDGWSWGNREGQTFN